jgi:hypothetical protein
MATTEPQATGVQAEALQRLLEGRYADQRRRILDVLGEAEFSPPLAIPTDEYRQRVRQWMQRIADEGLTAPGFPKEFGGEDDPGANIAGFETIAYGDLSLLVKFGVQFGLWGGAIQQLGTRIHHERYLKPTATLELLGCFAMTETGDLLERESQLELFRWREGHITAFIAQRFKRGLDEGYDPFEGFRAVQNHAVNAARAHTERVLLEAFTAAVEAYEEGPVKNALGRMCDLYALYAIEQDRGYLQEHGRLTGPRCKAVTREVNRLCDEVRGDAEALVDAFGIPDQVLRAPIGLRDPA